MARRRHLAIQPEYEDAIRRGRKTIDARPVADDIADVKVGGFIRYPGSIVRVTRMRFYPGFGDLLAHEDWHLIDPDETDRDGLRRRLEEGRHATLRDRGAVAIEFQRIAHSL
jgi:ASC-1-like (ASCH) protein